MTDQLPANVDRFLKAFSKPAQRLREENREGRNEHTLRRNQALIESPWEFDEGAVDETREITFLRDFFNLFHECMHSCETLDVVSVLVLQTLSTTPDEHASTVITFWSESYLNEVYILQLRLRDLIKYVERKYKRDKDFAEPVVEVCKSLRELIDQHLGPIVDVRGKHVHQRRYRSLDPELARLTILNTSIDAMGMKELIPARNKAIEEAREWLFKQTDHSRETCWNVFDGTCEVLAEGIITENGWIIVPLPFKDDPEPFLKDYGTVA